MRKPPTQRSPTIHIAIYSIRISVSLTRIVIFLLIFSLLAFLLISRGTNNHLKLHNKYNLYIQEAKYNQANHNNYTEDLVQNLMNNTTSLLRLIDLYKNGNILKISPYIKSRTITAKGNTVQHKNATQTSLSIISNGQTLGKGKKIRSRNIEVPYNVTGWPIGTSLSVEDYVDYFRSTSTLLPDTSRDSSTFDDNNNISVLIGIGRPN